MTPERRRLALCRMKYEWSMTVSISPSIVQPAFGIAEPGMGSAVSCRRPARPSCHGGHRDVTRKGGLFSSIGRAAVIAIGCRGDADGSRAVAVRRNRDRPAKACRRHPRPATPADFSARRRFYRGDRGAAAAAAFAAVVGTGPAVAASQNSRGAIMTVITDCSPVYYAAATIIAVTATTADMDMARLYFHGWSTAISRTGRRAGGLGGRAIFFWTWRRKEAGR